ncbi:hypothetical protein KJ611_00185 [Patescibacteria group bacterium]|nr:hypothetical protein [Patescibacteria group bacterium]MBU1705659.1 hypothetical protein [Patescibacteria group bacterium]
MSPFAQTMFAPLSNRRSLKTLLDNNIVMINVVSLVLVLAVILMYIFQVNGAVTKGYQMRDLETRIESLTLENQKLEVVAREAQSLDNVKNSVKMLGFVPAEVPTYTNGSEPALALAE